MNALRTVAALALIGASAAAASAATLHVPGDSATIRGALDLSADGDTIVVAAGTYPEFLFLDQRNNLTIQASGLVILAPKGPSKSAPPVFGASSCTNITLDGFTFAKSPADAVRVSTCLNVAILHCDVVGAKGSGFVAYGGQDMTIADCTVSGTGKNQPGINVAAVAGPPSQRCKVQRCTVSKTGGAGIIVRGSFALVEDCVVTSPKRAGIELDRTGGTHDAIVRRCTITSAGDTGIVVAGPGHVVQDNQITDSKQYGIYVLQDSDGATTNDTALRNTVTRTKKQDGIRVDAPACTLDTNSISGAHAYGVHLAGSNHVVTANTATASKKADLWDESIGSVFAGNSFPKVKP